MKKIFCIMVIALCTTALFAKSFSSSGGHSFSSSSSSRSFSSTPSSHSSSGYGSGGAYGYSAPQGGNTYNTYNTYHSYGSGSYYGSGFTGGLVTGMLLSSLWSHPYGVVVYGGTQFMPYNGGYIDQQGNYYQSLQTPQQYQMQNPNQPVVVVQQPNYFTIFAIVIGIVLVILLVAILR